MDAKHAKAVLDLFNCSESEKRERIEEILGRDGVTAEGVMAAWEEVFSGNDVEGAAIGIAAVDLTYPDHDADEFFEKRDQILDSCCPLLRLQKEAEFSKALDEKAYALMELIFDAADRIAAGQTLGI